MEMSQIAAKLRNIIRGPVKLVEPMARHTSFKIGGPADIFVVPANADELRVVLLTFMESGVPFFTLGCGTNVLVADDGIRGAVIKLGAGFDEIEFTDCCVTVGAGATLTMVAKRAARMGLSGFEFAYGIPGSVGGALVMNAGAYGSSMASVVSSVTVMDHHGRVDVLERDELGYGYRTSMLREGNFIVLSARLRLQPASSEQVRLRMAEYLRRRRSSQPLNRPSAGSVFKNPEGDYAGRLLDSAGCRGMRFGDAQVSEVHANFIVNLGEATARDVLRLMSAMRQQVYEKHGILLEPEIVPVGF